MLNVIYIGFVEGQSFDSYLLTLFLNSIFCWSTAFVLFNCNRSVRWDDFILVVSAAGNDAIRNWSDWRFQGFKLDNFIHSFVIVSFTIFKVVIFKMAFPSVFFSYFGGNHFIDVANDFLLVRWFYQLQRMFSVVFSHFI